MERKNSSVLQQLSSAHQEQVTINRKYLQVIIECLIFTAMQNIAVRGQEESRKDIWEVSDINRGNFLELVHLRCKDLPWLQSNLQAQLQLHAQWTSPRIQNELLAIVSDLVLEKLSGEKNDKDASKPVARHFNLPNHSKKHMAICGRSLHLGTTESRKNLEQKFIFQIGTLNPHGINERFSFN